MSIYRNDRPNAPYRIYQSLLNRRRWLWIHGSCEYEGARGAAPTREQAAALAAVHATAEHGASLDHLRSLLPTLRDMGVFGANSGVPNGHEYATLFRAIGGEYETILRRMAVLDTSGEPRMPVGSRSYEPYPMPDAWPKADC